MMNTQSNSHRGLIFVALIGMGSACSSGNSGSHTSGVGGGLGSGGASSTGGSLANGGATGSGGAAVGGTSSSGNGGNGGEKASGGTTGLAGQPATGGTSASGGRIGSGGSNGSGGITPSGGVTASGGQPRSGGVTASGGRSGATDAGAQGGAMATGGGTGAGGAGTDGGVINPTACSTGTAQSGDVTVSLSSLQQKITGFGVSSAWAGSFRDANKDPDTLWSTTTGAGLTLLRVRIGDGTAIAKKAVTYGVKVWATPWEVNSADTDRANCPGTGSCTPPPKLKDPQDWANRLVSYISTMKSAGVDIYAISAENEPDSGGMNATTSYTAAELATWIGSAMGPALANTGVKIMAPETMNWYGFPGYFSAIQSNAAAWGYVSIFASHEYGLGPSKPEPTITAAGKEYWETEVDTGTTSDDSSGDGMGSALKLATNIHNDLTKANLNAWHYWWLYAGGSSGLFDTNTNVWTKRFWIMGNFSRFVRPGFMRVSTSGTPPSGVLLTAYTNQSDGTVAIVAINPNSSASSVSLYISGVVPCTITPWLTSDSASIVSQTPITVSNARFTATLAAKSVTTLVGKP